MSSIKLEKGWSKYLKGEFEKPYMVELSKFLEEEYTGKTIYPERDHIFAAFNNTPFDKVKVVIIGQDPYHGKDQAHGLCFSVRPGVRVPPSLLNIYKELNRDLGIEIPTHGYLMDWAKQGILLLNATLTVEASKAGSHQNKGWETFTDTVVEILNREKENLIFVLWGSYAQKKGENISDKHLVLKSTHPSPFSAYRGFLGCGHFTKINQQLARLG
ncbi:MAG: uracil-DNA glycosylase, partial [Deltaproteobacteria bacterium]